MTGNWWEESSGCYDHPRATELIALMRVLVAQAGATDAFDALENQNVGEIVCADGRTLLQKLGENSFLEVSSDVPPETIYVLLGERFLVQMCCVQNLKTGKWTSRLDMIEGYAQARQWLFAHAAAPPPDGVALH